MRSSISRTFSCLALGAGLLLFPTAPQAAAAVLDWNDPGIVYDQRFTTAGQTVLSQTFMNVNGSGVDVTISLTLGSVNTEQGEVFNSNGSSGSGRLRDNNAPFNARGGALDVGVLFGSEVEPVGANTRATDYVRLTISFSEEVNNMSFSIWDIDYTAADSGYQDVIRNFMANGSSATPGISTGANAQVFAGGTAIRGIDATADGATTSDALINYGNGITSISFDYAPGDGTGNTPGNPLFDASTNPSFQHIGIGNITFSPTSTPVPEVFSGQGALFACFAVVAAPLFGRRRRAVVA